MPWLCQYVIEAPPPDTCTLATAGSVGERRKWL